MRHCKTAGGFESEARTMINSMVFSVSRRLSFVGSFIA